MSHRYASIIWGIFVFIMTFAVFPIYAQEENTGTKVREELISIDVRERPFSEIIDGIRQQTGENIIYDEDIKDIYVTIRLIQVPWKKVIEVIAKENNCLVEDLGLRVLKVSKPPTVTMEFEGADIRDVIHQIATIANRNIVVSEQVKGSVFLRLKNVPWQDALEAIIKTRGYVIVSEKEGRILRVVPPSEIETQLETRIFKLAFVRPRSIYVAKMSSNYFEKKEEKVSQGKGVDVSKFSLLGALEAVLTPNKGRITYDEATNTLVITDVKPKIDKMAEIIRELDLEPRQVFLDIKFIRTTNNDIFEFGMDTGENGIRILQDGFGAMANRLPFTLGTGGWEDKIAAAPESQLETDGFPSDNNITSAVTKPIEFGTLSFKEVKFTLRLLKRDVKSKVIQAPKIITLDHHESTIFVGRTISYAKTELLQNDNGTTSVAMKEADNSPVRDGFQILVIPHVIPGTNKVQLTVIPSNDEAELVKYESGGDSSTSIELPTVTQQVVVTHDFGKRANCRYGRIA